MKNRSALSASEREVMNLVRQHQPIARAKITELTSLTQQSVHRLVEGLTSCGFLASQKAVVTGRGKPSPQIILDETSSASLGISIRTDKVEVCAITPAGTPLVDTLLTIDPNDRDGVLRALQCLVQEWVGDGPLSGRTCIGVGAAIQGYRTTSQNRFTTPLPIESWSRLEIDELLSSALDMAAFVENNANCSALAELHNGGGRKFNTFAYLSFNFGFGGGIICNSEPILGRYGNAGELSELFEIGEMERRPALGELIKRLNNRGVHVKDISDLRQRFDIGWNGIHDWVAEVSPLLNLSIRAIKAIADPEAIFFGGEAPDELRKKLINVCSRPSENRYGEIIPFPELLPSELSGDAAATGAAILPLKKLLF